MQEKDFLVYLCFPSDNASAYTKDDWVISMLRREYRVRVECTLVQKKCVLLGKIEFNKLSLSWTIIPTTEDQKLFVDHSRPNTPKKK
jgi:hypothetical protein